MHDKHWSDEQLIDRLYGIEPEGGHLAVCPRCEQRWQEIRRQYERLRPADIEVSEEFLVSQRRAIRNRLGENRHSFSRVLVPVTVTLLLVAMLAIFKPGPAPPPPVDQITDSQLFEDVFQRVSGTEPAAVEPIRALFEVPQ